MRRGDGRQQLKTTCVMVANEADDSDAAPR